MTLHLKKIYHALNVHTDESVIDYAIPDLWNAHGFKGYRKADHQLYVNPWHFYCDLIERVFLSEEMSEYCPSQPLSFSGNHPGLDGNWVKQAVFYSSMIRASSAWDSDGSNSLEQRNRFNLKETGTFVKMLALLPHLKTIGITTLYLLPVSALGKSPHKGELGSPYAVKNFTLLDENLKDPMTGNLTTVDDEFAALVEACHLLGMRVVIDIIPRTMAIDNDWLKNHPEWFYWIDLESASSYQVPMVPAIHGTAQPLDENIPRIYQSESVQSHLRRFRNDPKTIDSKLFDSMKDKVPLLKHIEETFKITIAPAFSDHINDTQPPWSDVTFLRLYHDHPKTGGQWLENPTQPPYILFDTIKANLHPGAFPNQELWEALSEVIPSYQKRFGIDGARIDMGHALPKTLIASIIDKAKALDKDFAFIAEELEPSRGAQARQNGYHMILGNAFFRIPRVLEGEAKAFFETSHAYALPVFACGETHDTPRLAARLGGETASLATTLFSLFAPNAVPFINSAQEVFERQPMNLGLDCDENERYRLPKHHPYYGKLALFDRFQFAYDSPRRYEMRHHFEKVMPYRKRYLSSLIDKSRTHVLSILHAFSSGYWLEGEKSQLIVLANFHFEEPCTLDIRLTHSLIDRLKTNFTVYECHSTHESFTPAMYRKPILSITLQPGEVRILELY